MADLRRSKAAAPRRSARTRAVAPARLGLANALFSGTQQRVLGLLFGQPDRSFYATEVIALTQGGTGAIQRELARLAQSGLATVRFSGNQKHFQANRASPIFEELSGIVRKTVGLADPLRAALAPLAPRIKAAFVYGSVAKKEDTVASDIDLMIVSDDVSYADLYAALENVSEQLGRTVNPTIFTSAELRKRLGEGGAFAKRVMAQPKIWVLGDPDALAA
jgi:predicted nucleotidyltransferase